MSQAVQQYFSNKDKPEQHAAQFLAESYKRSLYSTAKHLLGYKDINTRTHGGIIRALEASTRRKLICVPRGCFKSSIASVSYPIWLLIRNPNLRILIDSELYSNSCKFLIEIKAHMKSAKMMNLFGEFEGPIWTQSEIVLRQRMKIKKEASITCSGIGAGKTSAHYDIIIADDMNSPQNSLTVEARQKVIDHYRLYTSLLEPNGTIVIIGTRYAQDDLIGWIIKNEIKPLEVENVDAGLVTQSNL